uniref:Uncharacterized protein n=1 Tax=Pyxicephalus adspersus TaxID=30357 RepID=A0AAV3A925_PYXAD|nr:TPA: hypothetical protein GDO54_014551 [Pyxicephalus adspersus]
MEKSGFTLKYNYSLREILCSVVRYAIQTREELKFHGCLIRSYGDPSMLLHRNYISILLRTYRHVFFFNLNVKIASHYYNLIYNYKRQTQDLLSCAGA